MLCTLCSPGQHLDSLWGVWQDESQADTSRLKALHEFTNDGYLYSQLDSALYFSQMEYNFAKEKALKKYMAAATNTQGIVLWVQGKFEKAVEYFTRSLKIREEIGDKRGVAMSLNNIGNIYVNQGDYAKAIEYYTKSLRIKEEIGDKNGVAASLNNIGVIYASQGDYAKALEYLTRSLKIREKIGDKSSVAVSLNNSGDIYWKQGDYPKAMDYFTRSLKITEEIGDKNGMASSLNNIGETYQKQGDYPKAMEYLTRSLKISQEIGSKEIVALSMNNIGIIHQKQGNYPQAIKYSTKALAIAQEVGVVEKTRKAAETLYLAYKATGQYRDALGMHELFVSIRDSMESEEARKEVVRREYQYAYEKKAAADSVKNAGLQKVKDARITAQQAQIEQEQTRRYALYGGLGLVLLFSGFIFNRFRVIRKQKWIINEQKDIVEQKQEEVMDSIRYARRIQEALLKEEEHVTEYLPPHFILFKPKDVVSGDFYWALEQDDHLYMAAADCTGHGVPGAFLTMLGTAYLNEILNSETLPSPARILDQLREKIVRELGQTGTGDTTKDGMDISLIRLNLKTDQAEWAGANNPLWLVRQGRIEEIKADKQPIGYHEAARPFTNHKVQLKKGDMLYLFSDGFADQFGGEMGKKFKKARFKELVAGLAQEPVAKQKTLINQAFANWKGALDQLDDVCVIGIKIT